MALVIPAPWLQTSLLSPPHTAPSIRPRKPYLNPLTSTNCHSAAISQISVHSQKVDQHRIWSRGSNSMFWGASPPPPRGAFAKQQCVSRAPIGFCAVAVMKESQTLPMGTRAPDFRLPEPLTSRLWSLEDFVDKSVLLVMFISNHCPFVKHLKPSMKEIADEYMAKGVGVVAISSNSILTHPQDGPDEMARDAKLFKYAFPYLYDEAQEVAKTYRAACTPDFYVFEKEGRAPFQLAYHGQWDDSRPSNGVSVTGQDIRAALDLVVAGQPVSPLQRPSIGCNIKWHPGKEPEYF